MVIDRLEVLHEEVELPEEFDGLPVFAVGGAVRDVLRGESFEDIDLMVAEIDPEGMRRRGFREIDSPNNDTFGVFQDSLGREVAVAREERSTGDGHTDFEVAPVPRDVRAGTAVERDLKRRDFTVNAMAFDIRWSVLHDPHGGLRDLEDGIIRAVSSKSFEEDPLRILRGARFSARLEADIESVTETLMMEAVDGLRHLPSERIRMEMEKALAQAEHPRQFFDRLDDVGALDIAFPELAALIQVPAGPEQWHKEGDSFEHTMLVLEQMKERRPDNRLALLMALAHDLGKGTTPEEDWPSHGGHTKRGAKVVDDMAERLSMSNTQKRAMKEAALHHMKLHDIDELRESTVIDLWKNTRHTDLLMDLAVADAKGRIPQGDGQLALNKRRLAAAHEACREWQGTRLIEEGYSPDEMGGKEFGDLLHQRRVEYMRELERNL